jgi:SSS family solute:Na+ symporter
MGRLVAELNKGSLDGLLFTYADINFLHFAILLFLVCTAVLVGVSLLTPPPPPERVDGLTFGGTAEGGGGWSRGSRVEALLTLGLLLCVAALWIYFS